MTSCCLPLTNRGIRVDSIPDSIHTTITYLYAIIMTVKVHCPCFAWTVNDIKIGRLYRMFLPVSCLYANCHRRSHVCHIHHRLEVSAEVVTFFHISSSVHSSVGEAASIWSVSTTTSSKLLSSATSYKASRYRSTSAMSTSLRM